MALYVGGTKINRVVANGTEMHKLYCNGTKVWGYDIEYVGSASIGYSSTGTKTISLAGIDIQPDDFMVCTISNGYHTSSPAPNVPTGFTSLFARSGGSNSTSAIIRVAYKVATGDETLVSFSANISTSGGGAVVHIFRYVDTTNPFDVESTSFSGNTYTNNVNPIAITPVTEGSVILVAGVCYAQQGGSWTTTDLLNFKQGSGYYSAYGGGDDNPLTYYYGSAAGMGYLKWNGNGTYDPQSWTFSGYTGGANYMCLTMALRPKY